MSENVLTKMVKDYKKLTAMIDKLKQEAENIADEMPDPITYRLKP